MAHFAKIDKNNVVIQVVVVDNQHEDRGQEFLSEELGLGGTWIQTSYNTVGGTHLLGGNPLRKNYAGVGYTYDAERDAFIPPKNNVNDILDEDTCLWIEKDVVEEKLEGPKKVSSSEPAPTPSEGKSLKTAPRTSNKKKK
jgi:hypothetical protein